MCHVYPCAIFRLRRANGLQIFLTRIIQGLGSLVILHGEVSSTLSDEWRSFESHPQPIKFEDNMPRRAHEAPLIGWQLRHFEIWYHRLSNFQPSPNCWKMLEDAIVLRLLFDLIVQESAAPPSRVPSSWIDKHLQNLARRDVNSTLTSELNLGWIYGLVCWAVKVWKKHIAYWCLLYIGMHWDVLMLIGKYSIVWTCSHMFAPCMQMHSNRDGQTWKALLKAWCSIDMTRTGQDQPGPATILRWWGKWCHLRAMVHEDQKCDLEGAGGNVCSSQEALKMRPVLQELTAFKKKSASACSHNSGRQLSSSFGYCNYLESLVGYDYDYNTVKTPAVKPCIIAWLYLLRSVGSKELAA